MYKFPNNYVLQSLNVVHVFILVNSAGPDEMMHFAALFAKLPF